MPIGDRVLTIGPRIGPRLGLVGNTNNPLPTVTRDSSSLIYFPSSAGEWTTTLTAAALAGGNPGGLWLCQDASSNLADAIGANPLVSGGGTPAYLQSNTGLTRKSVNITATTVQAFSIGLGLFDPSTTSVAWYGACCLTATPGGNRTVLTLSNGAAPLTLAHNAANKLLLTCGAGTATSVNSYTTAITFPVLVVYDLTHSTCTLYTGLEALTVAFVAVNDGSKGIGAVMLSADSAAHWSYLTAFSAAAAEQFTTSGARTLYSTLGWSPLF